MFEMIALLVVGCAAQNQAIFFGHVRYCGESMNGPVSQCISDGWNL